MDLENTYRATGLQTSIASAPLAPQKIEEDDQLPNNLKYIIN